MKRPSSARTSGEPEALQALPDSDDLGPVFSSDEPCGSHQVPKDYLEYGWWLILLKAAAAKIPSNVMLPYSDLPFGSPPASQNVRCTLWEIFSLPRLQATMQQLGGTMPKNIWHQTLLGPWDWSTAADFAGRHFGAPTTLDLFVTTMHMGITPATYKLEENEGWKACSQFDWSPAADWHGNVDSLYSAHRESNLCIRTPRPVALAWDRDSVTWFYQNRDAPNPYFFVFRI